MGLEYFYGRYVWTVTGCWPGALQFTAHGRRDEVLMGLDLGRLLVLRSDVPRRPGLYAESGLAGG